MEFSGDLLAKHLATWGTVGPTIPDAVSFVIFFGSYRSLGQAFSSWKMCAGWDTTMHGPFVPEAIDPQYIVRTCPFASGNEDDPSVDE